MVVSQGTNVSKLADLEVTTHRLDYDLLIHSY